MAAIGTLTPTPTPTIGDPAPGYHSRTIRPTVRLDGWGPFCAALEPVHPLDAGAAGWSTVPEWRLRGTMAPSAVRVEITGRTVRRYNGALWVRCRVVFCGDCAPSQFLPGWALVD